MSDRNSRNFLAWAKRNRIPIWNRGVSFADRQKRRSRKKHHAPKRFYSSFSRYRERNPTFQRFGNLKAGTKVGTRKVFSGNQLSSSQNANTTGDHVGSLSFWRCWDSLNPGPPYKAGGPFGLMKVEVPGAGLTPFGSYRSVLFAPGFWWQYDGQFADDGNWLTDSVGNYLASGVPAVVGYDTLAWDKLKPQVAQAPLGQFLYELKDLPGQLATSANLFWNSWRSFGGGYSGVVMHPSSVADNFLNHHFGWVPFISDISNMCNVWRDSNNLIESMTRENGKWVRKRRVLKQETVQRHIGRVYAPGVDPWGSHEIGCCTDMVVDGITCKGYFDITEIVETKVWAVGEFTFYRGEFDDNLEGFNSNMAAIQRLLTLYGLRINPTLVWKVTPWTWAVDWFSRAGDFIRRLDDFTTDGIVSRGLYIMSSTKRIVTKTSVINFSSGQRTFTWQRNQTMKVRKVADSPYGFTQSWQNLSAKQWAILGAIGISRSDTGFISRGA